MKASDASAAAQAETSSKFLIGSAAVFLGSLGARFVLTPYVTARGWRAHDTLLNAWSHVGMVSDSLALVGTVAVLGQLWASGMDILQTLPRKTAAIIGGAALASGVAMSVTSETSPTAQAFGFESAFHYRPNQADDIWGDATSILAAGSLTLLMRQRKSPDGATEPSAVLRNTD